MAGILSRVAPTDPGTAATVGIATRLQDPLGQVLPGGGLEAGTVLERSGSKYLLLGLLAVVTETGRWAAVLGNPGLGLLAVAEWGGRLDQFVHIPDPAPGPVATAVVLLDGIGLVVLDAPGSATPARTRAVVSRVRGQQAARIVISPAPRSELMYNPGLGAFVFGHPVRPVIAGTWSWVATAPRSFRVTMRSRSEREAGSPRTVYPSLRRWDVEVDLAQAPCPSPSRCSRSNGCVDSRFTSALERFACRWRVTADYDAAVRRFDFVATETWGVNCGLDPCDVTHTWSRSANGDC